jgi:hypothetical protein
MVAPKICALTSMHVTATVSIFPNFTSKNEQYDDGQKNHLKRVEHLTEINKLRNNASCWLYSANILAMHRLMNVKK